MIQFLTHKEIDKKKWDKAIDQSTNKLVYAYSWYLDIVSPNWNALIQNNYETVMPLTGNKKYGIEYLYPPYFAQQLGVFSIKELSKELVQEMLESIPEKYKFIETNLNTQNTFNLGGYKIKNNCNIELTLNSDYSLLHKKYSEDTKRNIKKSGKHSLEIKKNVSPEKLIHLFRKNIGKKINNLTDKNYKVLLELITRCIDKKYAEAWGAFSENKLCAGVVWLSKGNRSIFLFSATNEVAKKNGAMFYLIDTFIKENATKNSILDFEGSNLPGLARFYKGFGSSEKVYLQIRKNNLPKLVRWIK